MFPLGILCSSMTTDFSAAGEVFSPRLRRARFNAGDLRYNSLCSRVFSSVSLIDDSTPHTSLRPKPIHTLSKAKKPFKMISI